MTGGGGGQQQAASSAVPFTAPRLSVVPLEHDPLGGAIVHPCPQLTQPQILVTPAKTVEQVLSAGHSLFAQYGSTLLEHEAGHRQLTSLILCMKGL